MPTFAAEALGKVDEHGIGAVPVSEGDEIEPHRAPAIIAAAGRMDLFAGCEDFTDGGWAGH